MNVLGWHIFRKKQPAQTSPLDGVLPRVRSMREHSEWPSSSTPAIQQQRRDRVAHVRRSIRYRKAPPGTEPHVEPYDEAADGWVHWLGISVALVLLTSGIIIQSKITDPAEMRRIMWMVAGTCAVAVLTLYVIKLGRRRKRRNRSLADRRELTRHWGYWLAMTLLPLVAGVFLVLTRPPLINQPQYVTRTFHFSLRSPPPFLSEDLALTKAGEALSQIVSSAVWSPIYNPNGAMGPHGARELYLFRDVSLSNAGNIYFNSTMASNMWQVSLVLKGNNLWCTVSTNELLLPGKQ